MQKIKNIFSTDLRKVVLVYHPLHFTIQDMETLSRAVNSGARTIVVISDRILFFNSLANMWEANQTFKRWKRKGVNIVFHATYQVDILGLAAISNVYPVYLNKYAEVTMDRYIEASDVTKSDIRLMLGNNDTYQFLETGSSLAATEVNSMKLISGISERNFALTIAAALLPQPQEVDTAQFCDMENMENVFTY